MSRTGIKPALFIAKHKHRRALCRVDHMGHPAERCFITVRVCVCVCVSQRERGGAHCERWNTQWSGPMQSGLHTIVLEEMGRFRPRGFRYLEEEASKQ